MSLFSGLFAAGGGRGAGGSGGGLFSKSSHFKQQQQQQQSDQQQQSEQTTKQQPSSQAKGNKKKRKQPASDAEQAEGKPQQAGKPQAKQAPREAPSAAAQPQSKRQKKAKQQHQEQHEHPQAGVPAAASDAGARAAAKAAAKAKAAAAAVAAPATATGDTSSAEQRKAKKPQEQLKKQGHKLPAAAAADPAPPDSPGEGDAAAGDPPAAAAADAAAQPSDPAAAAAAAADKLARTIFVGNLPVSVKRKHLKQLFSGCGRVASVRLRSVPLDMEAKQKLPRKAAVIRGMLAAERGSATAYVVFEQQDAVEPALAKNMTLFEGHHIRVDRAAQPASAAGANRQAAGDASGVPLYDPSRSVFLGNVEFTASDEEVIAVFADMDVPHVTLPEGQDTHVEAVRVIRDPNTNLGIGVGYVLFKTKAAARAALALDGAPLKQRPLRISRINKQPGSSAARGPRGAGSNQGHRRPSPAGGRGSSGAPGSHRGPPGVRQGGVQKRHGLARPGRAAAAASDWQGLQTKGKGTKLRGPKAAGAAGAGRGSGPPRGRPGGGPPGVKSGGGSRPQRAGGPKAGGGKGGAKAKGGKALKGKRPAVAARKAAQRTSRGAAAKK